MTYQDDAAKHLEREHDKEDRAKVETLESFGIKDEYFDEPPTLTAEQQDEILFRQGMIRDYEGKLRATRTLKRECEVLGQPTTWEDTQIETHLETIKRLNKQIEEIRGNHG